MQLPKSCPRAKRGAAPGCGAGLQVLLRPGQPPEHLGSEPPERARCHSGAATQRTVRSTLALPIATLLLPSTTLASAAPVLPTERSLNPSTYLVPHLVLT